MQQCRQYVCKSKEQVVKVDTGSTGRFVSPRMPQLSFFSDHHVVTIMLLFSTSILCTRIKILYMKHTCVGVNFSDPFSDMFMSARNTLVHVLLN